MPIKKLLNLSRKTTHTPGDSRQESKRKQKNPRGVKLTRAEMRAMRKGRRYAYTGDPLHYSNRISYDELVNAESAIGRTIFGPIPEGHQREFFEYRKNIWIWHESVVDPQGVMKEMTVRYEVRPNGVFKRPGDGYYQKIEGVELDNFRKAAKLYLDLIKAQLYC